MELTEIIIINIQDIEQLLDDRGIRQEDVRQAIAIGENTGNKFYRNDDDNRFLASTVLGKFNVYVEYSPGKDSFFLHSAYAHRIMLTLHDAGGCQGRGPSAQWNCFQCKVAVEDVDDIALHYNEIELPDAIGYRCPGCGLQLLSETLVMEQLFMAELMLEAK